MKKFIAVLLSVVTLIAMAVYISGNVRVPGLAQNGPIGPYYIVVERDAYGVPYRCATYTRDISFRYSDNGGTVQYSLPEDITVYRTSSGMTIVKLDELNQFAEDEAYEALGMTAESCTRVQERRYDPESDQFLAPGEFESDRATKEDDREPPVDPGTGRHHDPLIDLPPDAQGL